jgi:hypothetical protein
VIGLFGYLYYCFGDWQACWSLLFYLINVFIYLSLCLWLKRPYKLLRSHRALNGKKLLAGMWKEMAMVTSEVLFQYLHGWAAENYEQLHSV